eukprot:2161563-Prymnesium_polylepis.1
MNDEMTIARPRPLSRGGSLAWFNPNSCTLAVITCHRLGPPTPHTNRSSSTTSCASSLSHECKPVEHTCWRDRRLRAQSQGTHTVRSHAFRC